MRATYVAKNAKASNSKRENVRDPEGVENFAGCDVSLLFQEVEDLWCCEIINS